MELRPHQEKAVAMLRYSLSQGKRRPVLAAPCSFGKTITAAFLFSEAIKRGKKAIFICDRIKLVEQTLAEFSKHELPFGVMQGQHCLTDPSAPIQIASIQTLSRRTIMPEFDFAIVDECHTVHNHLSDMMDAYNAVPFVGLSATPFSKGLGKYYDDLIVPISPQELLEQNYLAPIRYYGGKKANVEGVRRRALPTGGTDYDPKSLEWAVERDQTLVGDIVENWFRHGENSQTIAFSPSISHSKYLVGMFKQAGVDAVHIDGYTDPNERERIFEAHNAGEFKILSCSKLLNTGYDAPSVRCLIDCYPTTSLIAYVQRAGRIARTHPDKEYAIYLDHSGNVHRHGFAESIVPTELDNGDKKFSESRQVKKEKTNTEWQCPDCNDFATGIKCGCGYEINVTKKLISDKQSLSRMEADDTEKSEFLGGLRLHAQNKGYKQGWADHLYKQKFGEWPTNVVAQNVSEISEPVRKYIKYDLIRRVNSNWKRPAA